RRAGCVYEDGFELEPGAGELRNILLETTARIAQIPYVRYQCQRLQTHLGRFELASTRTARDRQLRPAAPSDEASVRRTVHVGNEIVQRPDIEGQRRIHGLAGPAFEPYSAAHR